VVPAAGEVHVDVRALAPKDALAQRAELEPRDALQRRTVLGEPEEDVARAEHAALVCGRARCHIPYERLAHLVVPLQVNADALQLRLPGGALAVLERRRRLAQQRVLPVRHAGRVGRVVREVGIGGGIQAPRDTPRRGASLQALRDAPRGGDGLGARCAAREAFQAELRHRS
jgi:hypothetical protein